MCLLALGLLSGTACALFLASLDLASRCFQTYPQLVVALPFVGILIHCVYQRCAGPEAAGISFLLSKLIDPRGDHSNSPEKIGVPIRLAPMIYLSTLATHVCGGSAGREGTALQMSAGICGFLNRFLVPHWNIHQQQSLLQASLAAGFGGIFGTPWAGAIFALEVARHGRDARWAWLPCALASWLADWVCRAWRIEHTHYPVQSLVDWQAARSATNSQISHELILLMAMILVTGVMSGCVSRLFVASVDWVKRFLIDWVDHPAMRPAIGGGVIAILSLCLPISSYLGLGVQSIHADAVTLPACFEPGGAGAGSWLAKLLLVALTVGSGFKGGEVTPLFFIGAGLGHAIHLAVDWLGGLTGFRAPLTVDVLAGTGMVAVFAGATRTVLASSVLAAELFGWEWGVFMALPCYLASRSSGRSSIYRTHSTSMA
jgi:H+/Cl- antiporter ClcA